MFQAPCWYGNWGLLRCVAKLAIVLFFFFFSVMIGEMNVGIIANVVLDKRVEIILTC